MQINIPKLFQNERYLDTLYEVFTEDRKLYYGNFYTFRRDLRRVLEETKYQDVQPDVFMLAGSVYYDMHYGDVFQFDVCLVHPKYRNNRAVLRAFSKAKKAMVLQSGVTKYFNIKHLNSTTRLVQVKEY
ncbi:hypothetical protein [Providencia phage PSTRCR_114]|uniref:Uncharacterized protein n=1 Tax=Providencia phage PSTRCR_114 TaxID=2800824 RepID=A0A7T7CLB2_9CAUD|nr:hypothetical protein [Providencia phage PSTRCR_114]